MQLFDTFAKNYSKMRYNVEKLQYKVVNLESNNNILKNKTKKP